MLVTVERVSEVKDCGLDNLEIAKVDNQDVLVGKGEFKVNDLCVYFRAGSIIPKNSVRSEYLQKCVVTINKKLLLKAYRIKPMKVGDITSHGIAFTLNQFYHMIKKSGIGQLFSSKEHIIKKRSYRAQEHDDLTNVIGAFKFNPNGRYLSSQFNELFIN